MTSSARLAAEVGKRPAAPDSRLGRGGIGLISASNKHTKFGAVFGVD